MISVPFELEEIEFGILIPLIPLPEKSQKECSLKLHTKSQNSAPLPNLFFQKQ